MSDRYYVPVRFMRFMSDDKQHIEHNFPNLSLKEGAKKQLQAELQEAYNQGLMVGFFEVGEPEGIAEEIIVGQYVVMLEITDGTESATASAEVTADNFTDAKKKAIEQVVDETYDDVQTVEVLAIYGPFVRKGSRYDSR